MGFTRAELLASQDKTVPDLLGADVALLLVGINPGLWTAAAGAHFARPGNRFYPALYRAGVLDRIIDASSGYREDDRRHMLDRGLGITNIVRRATARADELSRGELRAGADRLLADIASWQPRVVAVLGKTAYRVAFGLPRATAGRQPDLPTGSQLWVVPNPSGLNAHDNVDSLAAAYREAALAAGISLRVARSECSTRSSASPIISK